MNSDPQPAWWRRVPRGAWAGGVLLLALGVLVLAGLSPRAAVDPAIAWLRVAGPGWYFAAMALVPLPLAAFTVPAGEAFAAQLTLGGVVAAGAAAVAVQQALSYWVARYLVRPVVAHWLQRRGQIVPRVTRGNALQIALLVRLTPGPPMILGSCVLALAQTPFGLYLAVSWLVALPWVCAGVILGRAFFAGDAVLLAAGLSLLAAVLLAARWLRRRRQQLEGNG
jgi:uncharacterized membrane protein YdjX (TVP38/TMEM64 family)